MARDLAIDLGTANTLVYMKGRGIVLNEPSVIALNRQTGEVLATGREAWQMIGRTPGYIVAVRPLRGGAITDFEITERMIRLLLQRVGVSRFTRPKVVICVPSAITEVERRAVTDAARRAGAADANLIEQPMAAAIGADLPIDEPVGNMVIDIGGGTSETAVISLGGIVALEAVRVGSFDIDASIQNYVRREHGIAIGERTAEEIKVAIGSADPTEDENQAEVRGRDLMTGLPKTVLLSPEEIRFATEDVDLLDHRVRHPLPRQGAARALPGLPRARHVPRRWRRPAARPRQAHRAGDEGAGQVVQRAPRSGRPRCRPRDRALRGAQGHVHGRPPVAIVRAPRNVDHTLDTGLQRIREQFHVPAGFGPEAALGAIEAARRTPAPITSTARTGPSSRSTRPAPRTSTRRSRWRRLATTSCCTTPSPTSASSSVPATPWTPRRGRVGSPCTSRTSGRGCTRRRCPKAPPACCPTGRVRPSSSRCAWPPTASSTLDGVERALVRSRAKLAYDTVRPDDLPPEFGELSRRIVAAEDRRGAPRVEFPEQELDRVDGRWALRFDPRLPSEDANAGMSLATNLAVADAMLAAGTGLFRVMDEPSEGAVARLRRTAQAFGLTWPAETSLAAFQRSLSTHDPRAAAFLIAVRRAGGGASYAAFASGGDRPWHAAMAATYAHATAPLRRLADRYVVEATLAIANGRAVPDDVAAAFAALPSTMASCEQRANTVDRAVIDLAEAVLLAGREGEVFDAVVVDEDRHGPLVQVVEPAVMAHVSAHRVDPGDPVRVRLVAADPVARRIEFTRVG